MMLLASFDWNILYGNLCVAAAAWYFGWRSRIFYREITKGEP